MEKNIIDKIQGFFDGRENKISIIDFLRRYEKQMPTKTLKKCIEDNIVKVDGNDIDENFKLRGGENVKFMTNSYIFPASVPSADNFFNFILENFSQEHTLKTISVEYYNIILSSLVLFIQKFKYDSLINSESSKDYRELLRKMHTTLRFSDREDYKSLRDRKFIEQLIIDKKKIEEDLKTLVQNVNQDNINPQKLLSRLSQLNKNLIYQNIVAPLCDNRYSNLGAIKNIVTPFFELKKLSTDQEKYQHFEAKRNKFDSYLILLNENKNHYYVSNFYLPMANALYQKFKENCSIKEEKKGLLSVNDVKRKYNFKANYNDNISIHFELVNEGEGLAKNIVVQIKENEFFSSSNNPRIIGALQPNEKRLVELFVKVKTKTSENATINLNLIWTDLSGGKNSINNELRIQAQSDNIDWSALRNNSIYAIKRIREEAQLFGRDDILNKLKINISGSLIQSYKLFGQKRVGKSSIVITLKNMIKNQENLIVVYHTVTGAADPVEALNNLGSNLCDEIEFEIEDKELGNKEELLKINHEEFKGSLDPLVKYIKRLWRKNEKLKFIFIIDEFDQLNDKFFLPGEFGRAFSLSIGKTLNGYESLGFILVGSENMDLLNYQDINYNEFSSIRVDTFDLDTNYDEYKNLITKPVYPYLDYSENSIKLIHKYTNGNPYFTNIICKIILNKCLDYNNAEIHSDDVMWAVNNSIKSEQKSTFAHFWEDGLTEDTLEKREKLSDIRRRILVSFINFFEEKNDFPNENEIIRGVKYPKGYTISEEDIERVYKSFFDRGIFVLNNRKIRILPELFEKWLCEGKGATSVTEGVSDLEAQRMSQERDRKNKINDDEYSRLVSTIYPNAKRAESNHLKSFITQFGSFSEQRIVFDLLNELTFISDDSIRDFFRKKKSEIFEKHIVLSSKNKSVIREDVEIFSSEKNFQQNSTYAEMLKTISSIKKNLKVKKLNKGIDSWRKRKANTVIIFEALLIEYKNISEELEEFLSELSDLKNPPKVVFISLVISRNASRKIINLFHQFELKQARVFSLEEFESREILPFSQDSAVFSDLDKKEKCLSTIKSFGHKILENHSNILFEKLSPNQSLPILWEKRNNFIPLFENDYSLENNLNKVLLKSNDKNEIRTSPDKVNISDLHGKVVEIEKWLKDCVSITLINQVELNDPLGYFRSGYKEDLIKEIDKDLRKHPYKERDKILKDFRKLLGYAYISEAIGIIRNSKYYPFFEEIFGGKNNFTMKAESIIEARNNLSHRDGELDKMTLHNIQGAIIWFERIMEKQMISNEV